ncbi:hypothetical protein [Dysgonomonas mossii]|uniref:hypothetical protein n=1 Tax=Dysgonomonas mossii TaxID=163665 RepID=UPI0039937F7F
MKEIILKEKDLRSMKNLNRENGYFILYSELIQLVNEHKMYREKKNGYKYALIEYRLTDINFHTEVDMLCEGKYDELIERIKEEMNS